MKFKLMPDLGALMIGVSLFALVVWRPCLTMSVAQMKTQAALSLDIGASQSQVLAFLRSTRLATTMQYDKYDDSCPPAANQRAHERKLSVEAKALLSSPLLLEFYFYDGKLTSYHIADGSEGFDIMCAPS